MLSDNLISAIQQMLILGKGDQGRLEYLLDSLQKGNAIPDSDKKYLQMMMSIYLGPKDAETYQKNVESILEQMHNETKDLQEKINKIQNKGFEKYVGRKAVLFFVTVFVGWNALQPYLQTIFTDFMPSNILQYIFPLNLAMNLINYSQIVWFAFLILLISWPFIGAIHLTKFIRSRKISNK